MSADLDAIRAIWQPSYAAPLSDDDTREIARNVTGVFSLLARWAEQDRVLNAPKGGDPEGAKR